MRRAQPRAHPKGYWNNPDNITNFFVDFAEEMEFDPFVAENWKTVTLPDIISKKVLCFLPYFRSFPNPFIF